MKYFRAIVLALMVFNVAGRGTLARAATAPAIDASTPSATTPASSGENELQSSIQRYLARFAQWKKDSQANAANEDPAWREDVGAMIDQVIARNDLADAERQLAHRATEQPNGGSFLAAQYRRVRSLGQRVLATSSQSYNDIVSGLLADYYLHPENRDAIYSLLQSLSMAQRSAAAGGEDRGLLHYVSTGTMVAWTCLVIWDWRGGAKGLLRDGLNVGRGFAGVVNRVRAAEGGPLLAPLVKRLVPSLSEVGQAAKLRVRDVVKNTREAPAALAKIYEKVRAEPGRMARGTLGRMAAQVGDHAYDLFRAALSGGSLGLLYGLNERYEPEKIDPIEVLPLFQAFAIGDLELQTLALYGELKLQLGDAEYLPVAGDAERLAKWDAQLKDLRANYDHFKQAAREFQGQVAVPRVREQIQNARGRWQRLFRDRPSSLVMLQESRSIAQLIETSETRQDEEARDRGFVANDERFVSLIPLDLRMSWSEARLLALRSDLRALEQGNENHPGGASEIDRP